LDTKFHEILYQASESRILDQLLSNFHHYVERVRKVSLATEGRAEKSNEEHHMIVEAIKAGDLEQAKELANLHVMNTFQNIDAYGVENLLRVSETQGN
jgi:DNA-binding GntR family transcriptional regulator